MAPFLHRVCWLWALAIALPAAAQPPIEPPLTLERAVELARERSPGLAGAAAGVRAADAGVQEARARPNPVLSYEAENVAGSGPYAGVGRREATATLEVPIELGGKRAARRGVADAERAGAAVDAQAAAADLTLHTTEAFIAVVASARRHEAAQARLGFADRALRAAELRVKNGKASPIEAQRAQVQQIAARVQADQAERAQALAAEQLARLTGVPVGTPVAGDWFDATDRVPLDETSDANLDVAARETRVAVARAKLVAAQRARIPDLTVVAGSRRFAETNDTATVVGVSLPLPLFNRGGAGVARARAELERSEADKQAAAQAVEQAVADARAEVLNARAAAAASSGPALAAATEAARMARIGYAEGKFSQLDLLDAERSWADTRRESIDALAAFHSARARLARLLGRAEPFEKD